MPQKYIRTVRQKPLAKYSPEQIDAALGDIDAGLTYRKCSDKHNIPVTVLHRHNKFRKANIGKHLKKQGGQCVLSESVETLIVEQLIICSSWGYPLSVIDLRFIVKSYLDRKGKTVKKFKNNMPGPDFALSFIKRHRQMLSQRLCQNIKRARTQVSKQCINSYFDNLEKSLNNVPPENIINYDETNLTNDPGKAKVITKRGCKYPERVMNSSKASTSIMFACTGNGELLPPYTVYKALYLYDSWIVGGPPKSRYNRSKSGWFDSQCFEDWLIKVVIPFVKNKPVKKILIGNNLSTHLTIEGIRMCSKYNVEFVFLPPNSTHLTQPLDVAFFRPLKIAWRTILTIWKYGAGSKESSVPKEQFPKLLNNLMDEIKEKQIVNIQSGFKKCGIIPINRDSVLNMLPEDGPDCSNSDSEIINDSLVSILKEMRYPSTQQQTTRKKRKRLDVEPGKSVKLKESSDKSEMNEDEVVLSNDENNYSKDEDDFIRIESDWNGSDEDDESPTTELLSNITNLIGVYSFSNLKVNDWIVGDFKNCSEAKQCSSKNTKCIGNVLMVKGKKVFGSFLKYRPTKIDSGKIFVFPEKEDMCWLDLNIL